MKTNDPSIPDSSPRNAVKELEESLLLLKDVLNTLPVRVFWKDKNSIYMGANRAFSLDHNFNNPGDIAGKDDFEINSQEQALRYRKEDEEVIKSGKLLMTFDESGVSSLNEASWFSTTKMPLKNSAGELLGVLGYYEDITDKKTSASEKELLLKAVEHSGEIIIIVDAAGHIQYVNPAFEALTGYTREEVLFKTPRFLHSAKNREKVYPEIISVVKAGKSWCGTLEDSHKEGKPIIYQATISPIFDADNGIINYVGVLRDITLTRILEEQMQQSRKMEAVGLLSGGVAHDFNNLLQVIIGLSDMALEKLEPDHPARYSLAESIEACEKAADLVKQLLIFSSRQVMSFCLVDLNLVVSGFRKMLGSILGEHIVLEWIPSRNLGLINGDKNMIEQVLVNLCANSRDALPGDGTVTLETENVVVDEDYCRTHNWAIPGRYVLLSVTDTGCGMDSQTIGRAFEPFFTTKKFGFGSGLGLSTVYGIVKQHGGMAVGYSETGKGTTFKLYFPVCQRPAGEVGTKIKENVSGGSETILIAEDSAYLLDLTKIQLEKAGYRVLTARDGAEAVGIFEKHQAQIDLVLLDVVMPELGGRQVYEILKAKNPSLKAVFFSGYSEYTLQTQFILEGNFTLVKKPHTRESLLRSIRNVLDAKSD